MRTVWYFSFRSPYAWLAHRDLTQRYPGVAEVIDWLPFWEPDQISLELLAAAGGAFPYVPMSREKHRYILGDVRRLARARGLSIAWPVDRVPCWEVPHLAQLAAEEHGQGRAFVNAVYRARWERGEDICDRATIAAVAEELGLPVAPVANAADDPQRRQQGVSALLSVDRDGVFGVPFFIRGHEKYWGLDRLRGFVKAVRDGAPSGAEQELDLSDVDVPALAADWGHAGGCG